jgi:hypothetical protein
MSNVIIPPEHQSSPKETNAEKAVKTALQEIHEGTFRPVREKTENAFGKLEDEFWVTATDILASHPRVRDAMRELETQVRERRNSAEYLEKAEMLHELNCQLRAGHKWEGQQRWQGRENEAMRLVNLMTPRQFIECLLKAGISAAIEPQVSREIKANPHTGVIETVNVERSHAKICLGKAVVRGVVGLFAWVDGEYRYVDKLQVPLGPEWTLMRFDEHDIPQNERYHGWRTAVLALIRNRVITEREAERAFGPVVLNPASAFYRQQLYEWKREQVGRGGVYLGTDQANTTPSEPAPTAPLVDDDFTRELRRAFGFEVV